MDFAAGAGQEITIETCIRNIGKRNGEESGQRAVIAGEECA